MSGPGQTLIDATYAYGFGRLRGVLPPDTTGGFPGDYYSSGYNAAMGSAGLASADYRDQGILDYEFMLANSQSGPLSWWESSGPPDPRSPWVGRHPSSGQGASPHAWGMAGANKVLLDSLVAQRADGSLVVGRGVPPGWLARGTPITVSNFPTTAGRRIGLTISSSGRSVSLTLRGPRPAGPVLFQLPSFVHNLAAASRHSRRGHRDGHPGPVRPESDGHPAPGPIEHGPGTGRTRPRLNLVLSAHARAGRPPYPGKGNPACRGIRTHRTARDLGGELDGTCGSRRGRPLSEG